MKNRYDATKNGFLEKWSKIKRRKILFSTKAFPGTSTATLERKKKDTREKIMNIITLTQKGL